MSRITMTQELSDRIRELAFQGKTVRQISEETKVCEATVSNHTKDIRKRKTTVTNVEKTMIMKWYFEGKKYTWIANELDRSTKCVQRVVEKNLRQNQRERSYTTIHKLKTAIGSWEWQFKENRKPTFKKIEGYRVVKKGQPCLRTYYRPSGRW